MYFVAELFACLKVDDSGAGLVLMHYCVKFDACPGLRHHPAYSFPLYAESPFAFDFYFGFAKQVAELVEVVCEFGQFWRKLADLAFYELFS